MSKFRKLDEIDISLYLIYDDIRIIICEIENDYGEEVFEYITENEFRNYIWERYRI